MTTKPNAPAATTAPTNAQGTSNPLEELEWLWSAHKAACEKVANGTGFLEWSQTLEKFQRGVHKHADYLIAAAREAETLRADAERYRWLRDGERRLWVTSGIEEHGTDGCDDHEVFSNAHYGDALDAAIDAARKGQGE